MNGRQGALALLEKYRRQNAWPEAAARGFRDKMDAREYAFCTSLCLGVLQNKLLLYYIIDQYSNIPTKKMEPKVLDILLISAYQV